MESFGYGTSHSSKSQNSISKLGNDSPCISKHSRAEGGSRNPGMKQNQNGSVSSQKNSVKSTLDPMQHEELPNMAKFFYDKDKSEVVPPIEELDQSIKGSLEKKLLMFESKPIVKQPVNGPKCSNSNESLDSESVLSSSCGGDVLLQNNHVEGEPALTFCSSPSNSVYTSTHYAEAKQSFTNTEASEEASCIEKQPETGDINSSYDVESRKTSTVRESIDSDISDESSSSSLTSAMYKPHKANDIRWEAIQAIRSHVGGQLELKHFKLLRKLGCGDIGSVYLSELSGTRTYFAMKVMDKTDLSSRKKLPRAQTEREILQSLDHPFLPTLYSYFETEKFSCLLMEYCPGGDLHSLRQKQHGKHFPEHAARLETLSLFL